MAKISEIGSFFKFNSSDVNQAKKAYATTINSDKAVLQAKAAEDAAKLKAVYNDPILKVVADSQVENVCNQIADEEAKELFNKAAIAQGEKSDLEKSLDAANTALKAAKAKTAKANIQAQIAELQKQICDKRKEISDLTAKAESYRSKVLTNVTAIAKDSNGRPFNYKRGKKGCAVVLDSENELLSYGVALKQEYESRRKQAGETKAKNSLEDDVRDMAKMLCSLSLTDDQIITSISSNYPKADLDSIKALVNELRPAKADTKEEPTK